MRSKSILITGASGLLGREVARKLAPANEVHAVVRREPLEPVPGVRYLQLDLSADLDTDRLPGRVDAVVHLAQSERFREFPEQAMDVFRVNVASTAMLLDHARRVGASRFIYASSGGVYEAGRQPYHERSPLAAPGQLGYYLGSKLSGEMLAQCYSSSMHVSVLRFFFIYGAGQHRSMLIPRLVDNIREGRPVTIQGEQGLRLNPVHVGDAGQAVLGALDQDAGGVFNVAGPEVMSLRELCRTIEAQVGRPVVFDHQDGTPTGMVADISAMRERLCVPATPFAVGLRDVVA